MIHVDQHVIVQFEDPVTGRKLLLSGAAAFNADNTDPFEEMAPGAVVTLEFHVREVTITQTRRKL